MESLGNARIALSRAISSGCSSPLLRICGSRRPVLLCPARWLLLISLVTLLITGCRPTRTRNLIRQPEVKDRISCTEASDREVCSTKGLPPGRMLFSATFESCAISRSGFDDHADNYISDQRFGGFAHTGNCSAGIGVNGITYGKLVTPAFPPSSDVWISGYVYFPVEFKLPACTPVETCHPGGPHIWRLHSANGQSSAHLNIAAGMDTIQLYFIQGNDVKEFVRNSSYLAADRSVRGKWQLWMMHVNLGHPGMRDGFFRFYSDQGSGRQVTLIDSLEHQGFLPSGADQRSFFTIADLQSNIGGNPNEGWGKSPTQGWYVDDVHVCADGPC